MKEFILTTQSSLNFHLVVESIIIPQLSLTTARPVVSPKAGEAGLLLLQDAGASHRTVIREA